MKTTLTPSSEHPVSSFLNGNLQQQRREDNDGIGEDEDLFDLQFHEIKWQPGMQCYAPWSKDGKLNAAVIKEVTSDGLTVTVAFEGYGVVEKCTTGRIKHPKQVRSNTLTSLIGIALHSFACLESRVVFSVTSFSS